MFDEHWYAGHALPGYSLLFAPLGVARGDARAGGRVGARVGRAVRTDRARRVRSRAVRALGACLFAVAAVGDVWSGRLTFALGVTFALACAYCARARTAARAAALLAGVCAAASPVAGVLLVLAGLTLRAGAARPDGPARGRAPGRAGHRCRCGLLFAEGGYEPYPVDSFAATAVVVGAFLWALPRGERNRVLRVGAVVYLLACLLCLIVHTPMGSNIERYGVLLAGPLLLCALAGEAGGGSRATGESAAKSRRRSASHGRRRGWRSCAAVAWIVWGPVRETAAVAGSRIDAGGLLRARASGSWSRRGAGRGAGGGAAHALALGGGAARAERVAGARLGEAAGRAL